jgi:putative transposase
VIFSFIKAYQAEFPIRAMCRVLAVSVSGYYAWRNRKPSKRAMRDATLRERIAQIHERSRRTYGSPRIHAELKEEGESIARKRVARLMRLSSLCGATRRKFVTTTQRDPASRPAPDLVDRKFVANAPNQLWVADMTYIPTLVGFHFLAVVLDVWSRKIVGWSMSARMTTDIVLDALQMAVEQRGPDDVIHHSDQGCQYTSIEFGRRCQEAGVRPSMGSVGDCYDNAMCESFFATLECELLDRSAFASRTEAELAIFDFIEGFYNTHRRHSALGYLSPTAFERQGQPQTTDSIPEPTPPPRSSPSRGRRNTSSQPALLLGDHGTTEVRSTARSIST